jgi:hypothetical protein
VPIGHHPVKLGANNGAWAPRRLYEGSSAFAGHKASLLFFDIDAQLPLALVAGASMLVFHVPAIVNQHRFFLSYRLILWYAILRHTDTHTTHDTRPRTHDTCEALTHA